MEKSVSPGLWLLEPAAEPGLEPSALVAPPGLWLLEPAAEPGLEPSEPVASPGLERLRLVIRLRERAIRFRLRRRIAQSLFLQLRLLR